ncbi:MAG: (Fe-S)-binding protein [Candidatus Bathyarchaeota archaeon]|nr:(Fe-S)-binding protein [Candidatus Bathyarchaeota archaeon]MDH5778971.1 (Fe-S)-binding protein [Candidatus Bathyarchaeota archaeon]
MTLKPSVTQALERIVGSTNVLTDPEDLYAYSFEHIFRERQYPPISAVLRTRSRREIKKTMHLAEKEGFQVLRRGEPSTGKISEPDKIEIVLLDDVEPPNLKPLKEIELKFKTAYLKEIHSVGHGTFRNFALALRTLFSDRLTPQCQECSTCSGYCTISPSLNNIETWSSKGRTLLIKGLNDGNLTLSKKLIDVIYTCSTCGLCFAQCTTLDLNVHEAIVATRHQIAEKGLIPQIFNQAAKNISETGDPSGMPPKRRLTWLNQSPNLRRPKTAEVLYWVGCTTATRSPNVAKAAANILNHAQVNFTTLGEKEGCCGYVLLKTGLWNEAKINASILLEKVRATDAKILVTPCAGCYYTFTELYPQILDVRMPFEVLHTSQLMEQIIKEGTIEPKELNVKVTYHDPCSLGRHCGVYESPRNVLKAIPKLELVEMPLSRSRARCCGAGGGLWSYNTEVSMNSASARLVKDAVPLDVDLMATCCPACYMNFRYAAMKRSIPVRICDVMELVERSMFS